MIEWLSASLILVGAAFSLLAAVGVLRMPDFYSRLQTSTKASTLGVGCVVLGAALELEGTGITARALLVVAFLGLTSPVAAQMLGRAAHAERVPLAESTVTDQWEDAEGDATGEGAGAGVGDGSRSK